MNDRSVAARRLGEGRRAAQQRSASASARTAGRGAGALAVAGYIADMTAQLESMATATRLHLLAYFLAMAHAESEAVTRTGAEGEGRRSG